MELSKIYTGRGIVQISATKRYNFMAVTALQY